MDLTFHIIYTSGTVQYLSIFLFSLLKWSNCSFRLVANGCSSEEKQFLQSLCQNNPRLGFLDLPSKSMMKHGDALDYLHALENSEYFCFMDSDILATGEFMGEFVPYLARCAGVFSGSPIWCTREEQILPKSFPNMPGRYNRTQQGQCIGSSYFAIYNNEQLTRVLQPTGMSFNPYNWQDIPQPYQTQFDRMGLKKKNYDTGKVLNLALLAQEKGSLVFREPSSLIHIGGISDFSGLEYGLHWDVARMSTWSDHQQSVRSPVWMKKYATYRYVLQVLESVSTTQPLPALPESLNLELKAQLELITTHITALSDEYRAAFQADG
jgi:hypothetical protein